MNIALHHLVVHQPVDDGADPGEAVDHNRDQSTVTQPEEVRLTGRFPDR